jgi:ADP-ribose pyrophosphatase YjhB (NUDIX family)
MTVHTRYTTGYSIGVGAVIVEHDKVLFVRRAGSHHPGLWMLPGGFVEPDETVDQAVLREVREETGLSGRVDGILAVRSRVLPNENSLFVVMKVTDVTGTPRPTCDEVDQVGYFAVGDLAKLDPIGYTARLVAERVLQRHEQVTPPCKNPYIAIEGYTLFA